MQISLTAPLSTEGHPLETVSPAWTGKVKKIAVTLTLSGTTVFASCSAHDLSSQRCWGTAIYLHSDNAAIPQRHCHWTTNTSTSSFWCHPTCYHCLEDYCAVSTDDAPLTCCRAVALFAGCKYVTPSHVTSIAASVLCHRITLKTEAQPADPLDVLKNVLDSVQPPL